MTSLTWYASRLRAMGPAEVALRAQRELGARLDDAAWRRARFLWRRTWEPPAASLLTCEPLLERPLGCLDAERASLLGRSLPTATEAIVARAERALAGRVSLLGYPEVTLEEPIDPSHDPFSGRGWPDRHGKLLDNRRAGAGDPKWIWELNRCQELPLLALTWRTSGDDRFAQAALRRLLTWLERSTPGRGIAWSNGYETALRSISFALAYDCLRGSPVLDSDAARRILCALWQHARFTVRDLSPPSSANNHLVGELAGLATVGLLAPELQDAERLRERGIAGLAREAERQILPDGTGAEQAFGYHLFVLDFLLLVAALARRRSLEIPQAIPDALARASDGIAAQVSGCEPQPAYGDDDDGQVFVLDAGRRNAAAVSASLAAYLGRASEAPDAAALLLFGPTETGAAEAEPADALLRDSGLVVLRRGTVRALFDTGPLGYLSIAAHGHADALQVTLSDAELELVTDPGTGSYHGDRARRAAFRGTAFHATVTVDGLDQAEQAGPFLWRRHFRAALRACDLGAGVAVGEHDGYTRLPDPVAHTRALLALEDGSLLVFDRLDALGSHRFVQAWPLHPALEVVERGAVVEARQDGKPRLLVCLAASAPGRLRLLRGEHDPLAGWWSRRLEEAEPAWTVQHDVECTGGVRFAALLLVAHGRTLPDPELRLREEGRTVQIDFVHDGTPRRVEIDLEDEERPVRATTVTAGETTPLETGASVTR